MYQLRANQSALSKVFLALMIGLTLSLSPAADAKKVKLKKLPDSLNKHGLVIIQLGPNVWDNAKVQLSPGRDSSAHDGFFVEKLKPGKYTLESITRVTGTDYSSFAGTSITTTNLARLPIKREFEIKKGQITHLGLLYMVHEPKSETSDGTEVIMLSFSNPGPEQRYLQKYYPELAASISSADVVVPEYAYSNDKLPKVRNIVYKLYAQEAMKLRQQGNRFIGSSVNHPVLFSESGWVFGDLGMAARPENGRITILSTDAVDRLTHIGTMGESEWFFSQAGSLYHTNGNKLVEAQSIPDDFFVTNGFELGNGSAVVVDNQFNIMVSADAGQTWSRTEDYNVGKKQALNVSYSISRDNAYIIGSDHSLIMKQPRVVVVDRTTGVMAPLDAPDKILKHMVAAFDTDVGLIIQTEKVLSTPTTLHLRRNGSEEWVKNEIMNFFGCQVSIPTPDARQIEALCGFGRVNLVSNDLGQTWGPLQQTVSQQSE